MSVKPAYTPDKFMEFMGINNNQSIYPKKLHKNAFTSRILHNKNAPIKPNIHNIHNITSNPIKNNFTNQRYPSKKQQNSNLFPISFPLPLHSRPHKFSEIKNSHSHSHSHSHTHSYKQHLSHRNIHRSRILSPKILPITTVTHNNNQNQNQNKK